MPAPLRPQPRERRLSTCAGLAGGRARPARGPRGPVALENVFLDESRLPAPLRSRFGEILRDDRLARVLHTRRQVLSGPGATAGRRLRGGARRGPGAPRPRRGARGAGRLRRRGRGGRAVRRGHERRRRPRAAARRLRRARLAGSRSPRRARAARRALAAGGRRRRQRAPSSSRRAWPSAASRSATTRRAMNTFPSAAAWRRDLPARRRPATGASTSSSSARGWRRPRATSTCAPSPRAPRGPSCGGS